LYRWGGDEFLLVVPSAQASDVLRRLQQAIAVASPVEADDPAEFIPLQVSLGAADYCSSEELETAIEAADRAMYKEKHRRKGEARTGVPGGILPPSTPDPALR
jgi:diguanylate cyclase (GGDEF)-like protein